jgi:GH15 family glucan-1,4-alpha-glucosidase
VSLRIEDYGLIDDCETACLVGKNGSIDWLCWPDFSSPACFAALVGSKKNGRRVIAAKERVKKTIRKYRDHSLILETRFETLSGVLMLIDFMPIRERDSDVVRIVRCLEGGCMWEWKVVQESLRHANSQSPLEPYTHALGGDKRAAQIEVVRMILPNPTAGVTAV